jgi:hypothetical protein
MFGRRIDITPRRFWSWFITESQGMSNALEALARGEADAEWAIAGLNAQVKRIDSTLEADVVRTLDGDCHLTLSGRDDAVNALLDCAPRIAGWRFSSRVTAADTRRIPFRVAPRPSLDRIGAPIAARHEAYII